MDPNNKEIFVEQSQSYASCKPVRIIGGKENHSFLHEQLRSLQNEAEELKLFDVTFMDKKIEIDFSKPKYMGDGKGFLNYLNVTGAYCYLCTLTVDEGQSLERCEHGMEINRHVKPLWDNYHKLMEKVKGDKEAFMKLSTKEREALCGEPIKLENEVMNHYNLASLHLHGHFWLYFKDIWLEHNSRKFTPTDGSDPNEIGKSIAELKAELEITRKGKKNLNQEPRKTVKCDNCSQKFQGYVGLKKHINYVKKNKTENKCKTYYKRSAQTKNVEEMAKSEGKSRKRLKPKSELEIIYERTKSECTLMFKKEFGTAINQVKVAGHGATVENFNTSRMVFDPDNREKVLGLFKFKQGSEGDQERENVKNFLFQGHVILSVTNTIGKVDTDFFRGFVKNTYKDWITWFGKFRKIKSSLHWTLAHVAELIDMNDGYSLAEYSENCIENMIKHYRYITRNLARQNTFLANCRDSLKALYILSRYNIRRHDKPESKKEDKEKDKDTIYIERQVKKCFKV